METVSVKHEIPVTLSAAISTAAPNANPMLKKPADSAVIKIVLFITGIVTDSFQASI